MVYSGALFPGDFGFLLFLPELGRYFVPGNCIAWTDYLCAVQESREMDRIDRANISACFISACFR
ncbi:hypothetical protein D3C86_1277010 [compost metagenome]